MKLNIKGAKRLSRNQLIVINGGSGAGPIAECTADCKNNETVKCGGISCSAIDFDGCYYIVNPHGFMLSNKC